jgi:hypothetical protein
MIDAAFRNAKITVSGAHRGRLEAILGRKRAFVVAVERENTN